MTTITIIADVNTTCFICYTSLLDDMNLLEKTTHQCESAPGDGNKLSSRLNFFRRGFFCFPIISRSGRIAGIWKTEVETYPIEDKDSNFLANQ